MLGILRFFSFRFKRQLEVEGERTENKYMKRLFIWLVRLIFYTQQITVPILLIVLLNVFSSPIKVTGWPSDIIYWWGFLIGESTPIFTLLDGFCSLLCIQTAGYLASKWRNKNEAWGIAGLLVSGLLYSGGVWSLYRVFTVEDGDEYGGISVPEASLLGSILTITVIVGLFGIMSEKTTVLESSLLFVYIVHCLYETFPQLSSSSSRVIRELISECADSVRNRIPNLEYETPFNNVVLPISSGLHALVSFCVAIVVTTSPNVILSFAYRIGVFYCSARIIPSIKRHSKRSYQYINEKGKWEKRREVITPNASTDRMLELFAPAIITVIYTHIMMQHSGLISQSFTFLPWDVDVRPRQFWNWINMFFTVVLYGVEMGSGDVVGRRGRRTWI